MTLLQFADGEEPFATGAAGYVMPGESEAKERITLNIEIEGLSTTAIVDTGAPYSICEREIAEQIGFDAEGLSLHLRYETRTGKLIRACLQAYGLRAASNSACSRKTQHLQAPSASSLYFLPRKPTSLRKEAPKDTY